MLIPIGKQCRTAYQVNEFKKKVGVSPISYPYDWTITPFVALQQTLRKEFNPECALHQDSLVPSKFGSILDKITQLIHHHDFTPSIMKELGRNGKLTQSGVPVRLFETDLISKAKGRFKHTFANIEQLRKADRKLAFIRWNKGGHSDQQLHHAFEKESISTLADVIYNYLDSDNFTILKIKSIITQQEFSEDDIIVDYNIENQGVSATILERKGFNGDGKKNFRGDTVSWDKLLSKYVDEIGINIS